MKPRFLLVPLLLLAIPLLGACGRKVGDACKTSFDCNESDNSRTCDIAQPGGYCTIDGCDERSCPSEAVCVRFFPRLFLNRPCNPAAPTDCHDDELCLDSGVCAPRATERRICAHACSSNDDCRGGYDCRLAGTLGTMALVSLPPHPVHFCAPHETP